MRFLDDRLPDRFWRKVNPDPMTGCWLWTGHLDRGGYGKISVNGSLRRLTHRHVYIVLRGDPGRGIDIDHLCRVRHCVNPAHLEAVTHLENVQRGLQGVLHTHCKKGHELATSGVYLVRETAKGGRLRRRCKACCAFRDAAYRAAKKAAPLLREVYQAIRSAGGSTTTTRETFSEFAAKAESEAA